MNRYNRSWSNLTDCQLVELYKSDVIQQLTQLSESELNLLMIGENLPGAEELMFDLDNCPSSLSPIGLISQVLAEKQ
jgi:hypothetical protein